MTDLNPNQIKEGDRIKIMTSYGGHAYGECLRVLDNKARIAIEGSDMWFPLRVIWKDDN